MKTYLAFTLFFIYLSIVQLPSFAQVTTLNFFIDQGLIHSPVLKDINNQVNSNTFDSLLIKAGQKPQINFNGLLYYAPVINGIGYSEVITNISNISSQASVTQRIFNRKTIEALYSKSAIQNQSLRVSYKISENDLRKAITLQYLSACSISNDLTFNKELLKSSREEERLLVQLVEKGLYRQVDYSSFLVELKGQELLLNDLVIQYQKEVSALNILCGLPETTYEQLILPDIKLNSTGNLSNSPFLTRFLVDSLKIQNEKLLIDRNYKPSVNWFSDAGVVNNIPREISKNIGFSVGLDLSVPIYDGQQRKLKYEKLKIAENSRTNYAGFFKQQFSQQLQQLYKELKMTEEIIPQINQQLVMEESVIKQQKSLINTGNISITDYVTTLKNYITIKRSITQYQLKTLQIITEINYWNQ
jgi:outer membrane protein TolC